MLSILFVLALPVGRVTVTAARSAVFPVRTLFGSAAFGARTFCKAFASRLRVH